MADPISASPTIQNLYNRIGWYTSSPSRIAQATYDYLDEVMRGRIDIVDPTNPFIMLLEMSSCHAAAAVNESLLNLRRQYPCLAHTDEEIYRHMTDKEYLGRFARPARANFMFIMELNALYNEMVFDEEEQCSKAIIPRDTAHTVDGLIFTHEYPIVLRFYPNTQVLQITYDVTIGSPITTPSSNVIQYVIRRDGQGIRWLQFQVPLKQMEIASLVFPIQKQSVFRQSIEFSHQFLYARVFNKSNTQAEWTEMRVTHEDQIFDNNVPTAVLTVTTGRLDVSIPYIYNTLPVSLTGQIRVDVYTTRGDIVVKLSSYNIDLFSTQFRSINETRDVSVFTNVWSRVSVIAFSQDVCMDGKNAVSFQDIRQKVVNYATGVNEIPITTTQIDALSSASGFDIIRNADPMTDRYFLGLKFLPTLSVLDSISSTQKRINRVGMAMVRFSATLPYLQQSDNVVYHLQTKRLTMMSNTMFKTENHRTSMVDRGVIDALKLLSETIQANTINSASYFYTPYYYVFDPENQLLEMRAYDLDRPTSTNLNFVRQNQSLRLPVNTGQFRIEKTFTGFRLTLITSSGLVYRNLSENEVGVQIRLVNKDETRYGYIRGTPAGIVEETQERIYTFEIQTDHDIDSEHNLRITNAFPKLEDNEDPDDHVPISNFYVPLALVADIFYTTTSVTQTPEFTADLTDSLINRDIMLTGTVGNTHDTIDIQLGQYLEHLWTRVRTYANVPVYQTSPATIPALYERDVYETDPVSGSIFQTNTDGSIKLDNEGRPIYVKLHSAGDPVLDDSGEPVNSYVLNDVMFDSYGRPIVQDAVGTISEFDIFVLDGKLRFVTDEVYKEYQTEITRLITRWITEDILTIQARLLERTKIFFFPETTLGLAEIRTGEQTYDYLEAEQSLRIVVYADESVVKDPVVQADVTTQIANYLDFSIRQKKFTLNMLESDLRYSLGSSIFGVSIFGFGGEKDLQSITIKDPQSRLSLKKKLLVLSNNTITLADDISITFQTF